MNYKKKELYKITFKKKNIKINKTFNKIKAKITAIHHLTETLMTANNVTPK